MNKSYSSKLTAKSIGEDGVVDTEHLDNHGAPDGISINGSPVCAYGVSAMNEGSRHFGGNTFVGFGGAIGCIHS